jgi:hypothetical protein
VVHLWNGLAIFDPSCDASGLRIMLTISSSVSAESNEFISTIDVIGLPKEGWSVAVERVRCDAQSDEENDGEDEMNGCIGLSVSPC